METRATGWAVLALLRLGAVVVPLNPVASVDDWAYTFATPPREVSAQGHSTMLGYFEDPENTARTIDAQGWLRTGDEGFFRLDGGRPVFFVTGRLKGIIIRNAEKFSPLRLPRDCAAVARVRRCQPADDRYHPARTPRNGRPRWER